MGTLSEKLGEHRKPRQMVRTGQECERACDTVETSHSVVETLYTHGWIWELSKYHAMHLSLSVLEHNMR